MTEFRSKVDGWFVAAAFLTAIVAALALLVSIEEGSTLGLFLSPAPVVLVAWIWLSTRYVVTDRELVVRCAFVRAAIPLDTITRLRRTSSLVSGPALSLDRIEVRHVSGSVVISPSDPVGFARAIAARCPSATMDLHQVGDDRDARVTRARRYAALAIVPALAAAALLIVVLNVWQPAPPRVTVAGREIRVESGSTTTTIPFSDIVGVSLEQRLPALRKRSGLNSLVTLRGRFTTGDSTALVHVSRRTPPFVVIRSSAGLVIVNFRDPQRTRALYQEIASRRGVAYTEEPAR